MTVFQIIFFRLLFSGTINDVIFVLGDCHVLLDQGICFESSIQCSRQWIVVPEKAERKRYCHGRFLVTPHMFVLFLDVKIY